MGGNPPFRPVVPQRLYQQVAEQIAAQIREGAFGQGARLPPERDLAQMLGVSRPTVREAMIALEIAGLVDVRSGSGVYVAAHAGAPAPLGDAGPSLFDILVARGVVEGEVAAMAALRADAASLARLEPLIAAQEKAMRQGEKDGRTGGHAEDRAFHLGIAAIAGNDVLSGFVIALWDTMFSPVYARLSEKTEGPLKTESTIADHLAILAALRRGDPDEARAAMRAHVGHTEALFLDDPVVPSAVEAACPRARDPRPATPD